MRIEQRPVALGDGDADALDDDHKPIPRCVALPRAERRRRTVTSRWQPYNHDKFKRVPLGTGVPVMLHKLARPEAES